MHLVSPPPPQPHPLRTKKNCITIVLLSSISLGTTVIPSRNCKRWSCKFGWGRGGGPLDIDIANMKSILADWICGRTEQRQWWKLFSAVAVLLVYFVQNLIYCVCNTPFAWWRHFTTTIRIFQGFAFLCKLGLLLFVWIWKEKQKGFWS